MTIYKKRFILKKTIFLSALLLLFCEVVFCQEEVRQLTIDDAVILAADNNLSLKRNQLALNQLELKDKYSWNSVSPSIGASAQFGNGLQENSTRFQNSAHSWILWVTESLKTLIGCFLRLWVGSIFCFRLLRSQEDLLLTL